MLAAVGIYGSSRLSMILSAEPYYIFSEKSSKKRSIFSPLFQK